MTNDSIPEYEKWCQLTDAERQALIRQVEIEFHQAIRRRKMQVIGVLPVEFSEN